MRRSKIGKGWQNSVEFGRIRQNLAEFSRIM